MTPKQQRFVEEFLKDRNATQAAIRCGVSEKSARTMGSRWLTEVDVAAAIDAATAKVAERAEVSAAEVLRELKRLALVDIGEAFNQDGTLKPLHEMSADVRRAISSVEVDELRLTGQADDGPYAKAAGRVVKLKFWDKKGSLELLGKHLKLFVDQVDHKHSGTINVVDPYAEPASSK